MGFICNNDGVPVFDSSDVEIWTQLGAITIFPPDKRSRHASCLC